MTHEDCNVPHQVGCRQYLNTPRQPALEITVLSTIISIVIGPKGPGSVNFYPLYDVKRC